MPFNQPYTPDTFHDFIADMYGEYAQSCGQFHVGQIVQIKEDKRRYFLEGFKSLGLKEDTTMVIDTLLVGTHAAFDAEICLIEKDTVCLLNCKLPTGDVFSANACFFIPVV